MPMRKCPELLPCPFCGGEVKGCRPLGVKANFPIIIHAVVNFNCVIGNTMIGKGERTRIDIDTLIEKWNKRDFECARDVVL